MGVSIWHLASLLSRPSTIMSTNHALVLSLFLSLSLSLANACPCQSVLISSTGGLQDHHPQAVDVYSLVGYLWEGRVPYYQAQNGLFLSPDRFSSPDGAERRGVRVLSRTGICW